MSSQSESKNGSQKKIMIIIAFIALIAALVVCIVLLFLKPTGDVQPTGASDNSNSAVAAALERGFVSEDSAQDIVSEMADKVAEGMFECKMTTSWTFDDAESASHNAYVANVENNRYTLYFDVKNSIHHPCFPLEQISKTSSWKRVCQRAITMQS